MKRLSTISREVTAELNVSLMESYEAMFHKDMGGIYAQFRRLQDQSGENPYDFNKRRVLFNKKHRNTEHSFLIAVKTLRTLKIVIELAEAFAILHNVSTYIPKTEHEVKTLLKWMKEATRWDYSHLT